MKLLRCETVGYYTVKIGSNPEEYYDFSNRMLDDPDNIREVKELYRFLKKMGDDEYGAEVENFKNEDDAHRVVANEIKTGFKYNEDGTLNYGLRLYCYRHSSNLVFLFNGDRKTRKRALQCRLCKSHFKLANSLAIAIKKAIDNGDITIDGKTIEVHTILKYEKWKRRWNWI